MTIGDVMAAIAGVAAVGGSIWAALVVAALLFGDRTDHAREIVDAEPYRALGSGATLLLFGGSIALILLGRPNGLVKLFGLLLALGLLALSVLGAAGLSRLIGGRIRSLDPGVSPFASLCRGAGLLVAACMVPVLGWFGIAWIVLVTSLGAGYRALRLRGPRASGAPVTIGGAPVAAGEPGSAT